MHCRYLLKLNIPSTWYAHQCVYSGSEVLFRKLMVLSVHGEHTNSMPRSLTLPLLCKKAGEVFLLSSFELLRCKAVNC